MAQFCFWDGERRPSGSSRKIAVQSLTFCSSKISEFLCCHQLTCLLDDSDLLTPILQLGSSVINPPLATGNKVCENLRNAIVVPLGFLQVINHLFSSVRKDVSGSNVAVSLIGPLTNPLPTCPAGVRKQGGTPLLPHSVDYPCRVVPANIFCARLVDQIYHLGKQRCTFEITLAWLAPVLR